MGRVVLGNERLSQEACSEHFSTDGSKFLNSCLLFFFNMEMNSTEMNELFRLIKKKKKANYSSVW